MPGRLASFAGWRRISPKLPDGTVPMSRIYIQRDHDLDAKTLQKRAENLVSQLSSEFGGNYRWEGNTVHYNYSGGIDARLTLQKDDILVDVKLGVLMLMAKKPLERKINKFLDKHLA
jgi:putative polyhydroxyalkanoate system protein